MTKLLHIFDQHVVTAAQISLGRVYKMWQPGRDVAYVGDGNPICPSPRLWEVDHAEVSLVHAANGLPYMGHYLEIEAPGPQGEGKTILKGDWQAWGYPAKLDRPVKVSCGIGWAIFCQRLTAGDVVYFRARYVEVGP
jgi:hypothetical protein